MAPLKNPRHEAFCQNIITGMSLSEAYERSGYKPHRGNASTMRQHLSGRIEELQSARAKKNEVEQVTLQSVLESLDRAEEVAKANGQGGALVSASALRAKLGGLDIQRVEVGGPGDFSRADNVHDVLELLLLKSDLHAMREMLVVMLEDVDARIASQATLVEPPVDHTDRGARRDTTATWKK